MRAVHHTEYSYSNAIAAESRYKLLALTLARKKLMCQISTIEENTNFLARPLWLFKIDFIASISAVSLSAGRTEHFWKKIYKNKTVLQDPTVLDRFEEYITMAGHGNILLIKHGDPRRSIQ